MSSLPLTLLKSNILESTSLREMVNLIISDNEDLLRSFSNACASGCPIDCDMGAWVDAKLAVNTHKDNKKSSLCLLVSLLY